MKQKTPARKPGKDRSNATLEAARAAVARSRALIERVQTALAGSESALAEAESATGTMNEVRRGHASSPESTDAA